MQRSRRISVQTSGNITFITNNNTTNQSYLKNPLETKPQQPTSYRYDENLIPTIPKQSPIKRISACTLHDLIQGKYSSVVQNIEIFDCRYKYEYEGGHIRNAIHLSSLEDIEQRFFQQPKFRPNSVFVFHCEFSVNRGPDCAEYLRNTDRQLNLNKYPFIYYPHIYILDGGYSNFYKQFSVDCDGGYTPMLDSYHCKNGDLAQSTTLHRKNFKLSKNNHTSSSSSLFILLPPPAKSNALSATLPCASTPSLLTSDYPDNPKQRNNDENIDLVQTRPQNKKFGRQLQFSCSDSSDFEDDSDEDPFNKTIDLSIDDDEDIPMGLTIDPFN